MACQVLSSIKQAAVIVMIPLAILAGAIPLVILVLLKARKMKSGKQAGPAH